MMNLDDAINMAITFANAYGKTLNDEQLGVYSKTFKLLTEDEAREIYEYCTEKISIMPPNPDLRKMIEGTYFSGDALKDAANEMVGVILQALRTYGFYSAGKAMVEIGPICQTAVERFGGWRLLCDINIDDMNTARAQLRDICKSVLSTMQNIDTTRPLLDFQRSEAKKLEHILRQQNLLPEGKKQELLDDK